MTRESKMKREERAKNVLGQLKKTYPKARMVLNYKTHWELLVAVMLSAQSTDEQVNKVTAKLFKKYKKFEDYLSANPKEFEQDIYSTGFYRQKTKSVLGAAKMLESEFNGILPKTIKEMTRLPGVARKTANVVLGNAYGVAEGVAVDTHVKRLSTRLGFTRETNPDKIEKDLMALFDDSEWFRLTYLLIDHGRAVCDARKPLCDECPLSNMCPSAFKFPHFKK